MKKYLITITLTLFVYCAVRKPPGGGPVDTTPPEVIATIPGPDSTGVLSLPYIEFRFSENMNRSSVEKAIRSNVFSRKKLKLKWKGSKRLRIFLPDSIQKGMTYVFSIGTEAKDAHGVSFKKPFTLAFSSDSELYRCKVKGKIFQVDAKTSVTIGLIRLGLSSDDTVWYQRKFTNIGTTNDDGTYEIGYIKPGHYRMLAFIDENYNEKFDLFEKFALFPKDLAFIKNGESILHMNTFLQKIDTSAFRFKEISVNIEKLWFEIAANKPIRFSKINASIHDTLVPVLAFHSPEDSSKLICYIKNPIRKDSIRFQIFRDGQIIHDESVYMDFNIDSLPEPSFKFSPPSSLYFEDTLYFSFNTPVDPEALKNSLQLSLQGRMISFQLIWRDYKNVGILPASGYWETDQTYKLEFQTSRFRDFWEQTLRDTVYTFSLQIISADELGGIGGQISVPYEFPYFVIHFTNIQSGKIIHRSFRTSQGLKFEFEDLPEGKYILQGFFDNGDGKWFPGMLQPFRPCEPYLFSTDTVRVRARWIKQGIWIDE